MCTSRAIVSPLLCYLHTMYMLEMYWYSFPEPSICSEPVCIIWHICFCSATPWLWHPVWFWLYVLGICGGSASGKTTVAKKIIEALDVPWVSLLSMDSFYKVWALLGCVTIYFCLSGGLIEICLVSFCSRQTQGKRGPLLTHAHTSEVVLSSRRSQTTQNSCWTRSSCTAGSGIGAQMTTIPNSNRVGACCQQHLHCTCAMLHGHIIQTTQGWVNQLFLRLSVKSEGVVF